MAGDSNGQNVARAIVVESIEVPSTQPADPTVGQQGGLPEEENPPGAVDLPNVLCDVPQNLLENQQNVLQPAGPNQVPNQRVDINGVAYVSTGLEEYLKKNSTGKEILKAYKSSLQKKQPLKATIRSKLVRTVIAREKNHLLKNIGPDDCLDKFTITPDRLQVLAQEIVHIFQGENVATYFTPFTQQEGGVLLANGKLWNHYNYTKNKLREAQLLRSKHKHQSNVLSHDELMLIDDNEYMTWLANHLEPWDQVTAQWTNSFNVRRKLLMETDISVYDYIAKFICLTVQEGKKLFPIDFTRLFPDKHFVHADQWEKIKTLLITYLDTNNRIKNVADKALVETLKSRDLSSEREDFILFHLLPYIITPKRTGKRKRNNDGNEIRKLSIEERRESFVLRVESANEVQPKILDLKSRYMRDHKTFQPVIIAVGAVSHIDKYYVVVNDKLYDVNTALAAVELAIQVFFSLDCKYPENTQTIWTFLQKVLFNLDLGLDATTIESNIIIGQIRAL